MTRASIVLGIGCRRGVSVEDIDGAVRLALGARSLANVRAVATIDIKSDELALLAFCERHRLPLLFFTAQQIARIETGRAVCEPCALLASKGGRIVVPKTIEGGVTVAIAEDSLIQQSQSHA